MFLLTFFCSSWFWSWEPPLDPSYSFFRVMFHDVPLLNDRKLGEVSYIVFTRESQLAHMAGRGQMEASIAMGVSKNGWFIMDDDLGVPPMFGNLY